MAIDAYTPRRRGRSAARAVDRRSTRLREAAEHGAREGVHWLAADPYAVIAVRSHAGADRQRTDASGPLAPVTSTATAGRDEAGASGFEAGLHRWGARVQRRRALVLARRQLTAGAALAAALQAFVLAGLLPQLALLAVLVPLALGMIVGLRRALSLHGVARLLDERLVLFDQLATALYLERAGAPADRGLGRRALARAHELLRSESPHWQVSARPARREWLGLAAALSLLALLVGLAASGAVSTSSGHQTRVGSGSTSAAPAKGGHGHAGSPTHTPGSKTTQPHPSLPNTRSGSQTSETLRQSGSRTPQSSPTGSHLQQAGETEAAGKSTTLKGPHPTTPGSQSNGSSNAPSEQSKHGGIEAVKPGKSAPPPPQGLKGIGSSGAPPASAPSTSSQGHSSTGAKGAFQGHTKGGNQAGSAAGFHFREAHLTAGNVTRQLALPAGYTPTRSLRGGQISPETQGNGGRPRSEAVNGSAAGGGVSAYVPPDGGASAEGRTSLLENYLSSLQWVEEHLASW